MGLAIATTSFECTIHGGLAHIVLNQADRGNPIDGEFCREFSLCMAELSERDDVWSVLISARGRLFSVGGISRRWRRAVPRCWQRSSLGRRICIRLSCEWSACVRQSWSRCTATLPAAAFH